jgi:hypothetical protein
MDSYHSCMESFGGEREILYEEKRGIHMNGWRLGDLLHCLLLLLFFKNYLLP